MENVGVFRPLGVIYGRFVQFGVIWYSFKNLVCLEQEKSGNPAWNI
jgi:hypothetical protein